MAFGSASLSNAFGYMLARYPSRANFRNFFAAVQTSPVEVGGILGLAFTTFWHGLASFRLRCQLASFPGRPA